MKMPAREQDQAVDALCSAIDRAEAAKAGFVSAARELVDTADFSKKFLASLPPSLTAEVVSAIDNVAMASTSFRGASRRLLLDLESIRKRGLA